jgi:hypothetical protein
VVGGGVAAADQGALDCAPTAVREELSVQKTARRVVLPEVGRPVKSVDPWTPR